MPADGSRCAWEIVVRLQGHRIGRIQDEQTAKGGWGVQLLQIFFFLSMICGENQVRYGAISRGFVHLNDTRIYLLAGCANLRLVVASLDFALVGGNSTQSLDTCSGVGAGEADFLAGVQAEKQRKSRLAIVGIGLQGKYCG
jgi:hypothetical protein